MHAVPYNSILGALLYLSTRTRPDMATVVSMLRKFESAPAPRHWNAMKHVLRYLRGTMEYGLQFRAGSGNHLEPWSDGEWARD